MRRPDLIDLIEKDRQGKPRKDGAIDHEVTVAEMRQALADPDVRAQLRSAACEHPSEWDAGGNGKWERLKKEPWLMPGGLFKSHMEMIEKQQFWADVFPKASPASKVWHFHPLGFIKQLRSMHGVTVDQLLRILPVAKRPNIEKLIAFPNEAMERYEIDTPLRQAHFLSQVGHESAGMRATVEDASGEAYEWRLDLHNVRPGDGKRFKGRGIMQLTGRLNYSLYSAYIGKDLTVDPRPLEEPRLACDSAGWFWRRGKEKDLNRRGYRRHRGGGGVRNPTDISSASNTSATPCAY
nr:hypothetical protein [Deltaproteobacteria bacterium]